MGSITAQRSIARVLAEHGPELQKELMENVKSDLVKTVQLYVDVYEIQVIWILKDETELPGKGIDIDALAERFPDCEVAY